MKNTKFIFITGGVVSSLGKGITGASLASILQAHGYKVRIRKLDPYLNVDPGTMSPFQHGEVYVTDDGAETDLDLGHYERFTDINTKKSDNVTSGQIYSKLLSKERKGDYLGGTVQVIPHVTDLIKEFILSNITDEDFIIYEIGGTVGDIEGLPFFEAIRQIGYKFGREKSLFIHLTLVPYIKAAKEIKTKPTQHSVKELRSIGIQPDILICRSEVPVPAAERKKIALFCNVDEKNVIQAPDVDTIYRIPLVLHQQKLDRQILEHFNLAIECEPNLEKWQNIVSQINKNKKTVNIAIVGKYTGLKEAYKSLIESLEHAAINLDVKVEIIWIDARTLNKKTTKASLVSADGVLVPGGFGTEGIKGKIAAITYARENNIPFFGICLGMQMAVIEFAENVAKINSPYSSEFVKKRNGNQLIGLMTEWFKSGKKQQRKHNGDLGGTMRLGAYPCKIIAKTLASKIYGMSKIDERHRHRYEFNINYKKQLEKAGMVFSGMSPDNNLAEIIELPTNDFFIAVQFHPELKSRPFSPHPLFTNFVKASSKI
jgi:CTP synthase